MNTYLYFSENLGYALDPWCRPCLVNCYSKNLVRLFLEAGGELTPAAVVADAISGPEYGALEVFD